MGTCAILGQAVGTAAALAARDGLTPREVGQRRLSELQQALMEDDCYLPWRAREVPAISRDAALTAEHGDPEPLRNGHDRPLGDTDNGWSGPLGSWVEYRWPRPRRLSEARLTLDSDLNRVFRAGERNAAQNMHCCYRPGDPYFRLPDALLRAFRLEVLTPSGAWETVARVEANRRRLVWVPLTVETQALRLIPETTWGAELAHLFAWDVR